MVKKGRVRVWSQLIPTDPTKPSYSLSKREKLASLLCHWWSLYDAQGFCKYSTVDTWKLTLVLKEQNYLMAAQWSYRAHCQYDERKKISVVEYLMSCMHVSIHSYPGIVHLNRASVGKCSPWCWCWCYYQHKVPIRNGQTHSPDMVNHVLWPWRPIPLWSHCWVCHTE